MITFRPIELASKQITKIPLGPILQLSLNFCSYVAEQIGRAGSSQDVSLA